MKNIPAEVICKVKQEKPSEVSTEVKVQEMRSDQSEGNLNSRLFQNSIDNIEDEDQTIPKRRKRFWSKFSSLKKICRRAKSQKS